MLRMALLSLASQSRLPDEVVVADDGSREDLPGLLKAMKSSLPFPLRFVTQDDAGFRLARCRNNGIRIASGDLVLSTDQDIVFTKDYVRTFAEAIGTGEFIVSFPVRLDADQTTGLTEKRVSEADYAGLVRPEQLKEINGQYRKDLFYRVLYALKLRRIGPKLRGGVFGAWREDLLAVNGFDENYKGWGNEDDDLGHRLYRYGITGRNVTRTELPLHLEHPVNNAALKRPNLPYYQKRLAEIRSGTFLAPNGIKNPLDPDLPRVLVI